MPINLSLNDFRSVLGKVNDGDIVFKLDGGGIEKANYGNAFLNLFRKVRTADSNPVENIQLRMMLLQAISASAEGKVIGEDVMEQIKTTLGIGEDIAPGAMQAPLTRRDLKTVIDIIDGATGNDALITKDTEALETRDLLDQHVATGVKQAMDNAACFRLPAAPKARVLQTRQLFGVDFNGRSPAEVEKFVRQNMAVIREQVFDRLYWSNPELVDFTDQNNVDDVFIDDQVPVNVSEKQVTDTFKEVVGELMEKFAARTTVHTRLDTIAPKQAPVELLDANAVSIWKNNVQGSNFELVVGKAFNTVGENVDVFTAVQLANATQAVKNQIRTVFNTLYTENGFNPQATENAFRAKMAPLMSVLNACVADMERLGPEASAKVKAKMAEALGAIVLEKDIIANPSALADAALKALDDTSKSYSARSMVEDFVNANFAYLEDKSPVITFFMEKIGASVEEGGITAEQATVLANAQKAAVDGTLSADMKRELEFSLMNPLKESYDKMVESQNPERIRQIRMTRNANAFKALLEATPGYAQKSEQEKADALIKLKINTLLCKFDHDTLFHKGITQNPGSESILSRSVNNVFVPVQEALENLDRELCDLNDRDFEFFSQYSAKGIRNADQDVKNMSTMFKQGRNEAVFKDALRDGTIGISSVPMNAVPLLKELVIAQVFAPSAENQTVAARDLLTREDQSSALAGALFTRLQERFAATGIKHVPARLKPLKDPTDNNEAGRRLQASGRGDITQIRGFGTLDPARILKLFAEMGIDLAPLDGADTQAKVDVYEKVMCLSTIAAMSGFKLDGLAEFCERIMGKPFAEVTFTDVMNTLSKNKLLSSDGMYGNITVADPIDKLSGVQKTAKELFAGEIALSGAKLSSQETTALLATARELAAAAPGTVKTVNVKINSGNVDLTRLADGALSIKVGGLPMRAAFDAQGLVRMIENEIASKPGEFDPEVVKSALPSLAEVESGAVPLVRARELYAKTAAAKTGTLPVMFSAYSTAELRDVAIKSVDGRFTAANLPKNPPATYNSGAMIEMHANMAKTSSAEIDAKVKIAAPAPRSIEERRAIAPDDVTVRNVIADLFLNKDTWAFDADAAGKAKPGERVRKLLVEHGPELGFILDGLGKPGNDLLIYLPENVRDAVKGILMEIKKLNIARLVNPNALPEGARDALAAIETQIDGVATQLIEGMQAKVTALFAPHGAGEVKPDWQKSFGELTGKEGIDENTRQGKFTMSVLTNYFTRSALVDKRAMLSAFIRNTDVASSDAKQVAELLKGAGPLLQKMLQGLPLSSFDPDTQLALKDMKSRLLPIPDEAVKAQMLELVRSSNGNILSIEVKKSLGAASVGQAFLCTIKTKEHPYIGEECVIKLLRPNVDTAIQREKAMIDGIIGDDPAMKATFNGQYRKILEEFDLTLESTNVGIGTKIYERPKGVETVHTMQTLAGSQSTMTSMILKKADGNTFDNTIERLREEADDILAPLRHETEVDGVRKTVYKATDATQFVLARRTLLSKAAKLNDRRNQILDVAKAWFDNALFGNGFFHGDLHGGNLMTGPTGTTFIDFGNCSRLTPAEQNAMKMMLAAVVSGDTDHVVANFKKLMPDAAKALFDQTFPGGSPAMKRLTDILKRGTSLDLMSRLQAFVAIVQGEDVPVPASLQNFVQSYVRLCDIVADIDRNVADIEIAANAIYYDAPEIENVEGEPKVFSLLKGIARAYVGDANTPYSEEAVRAAALDFEAYAQTEAGKAELRELTHDPARIKNELKPLIEMLRTVRVYGRYEAEPVEGGVRSLSVLGSVLTIINTIERLEQAGKIQNGQVVSDDEEEREILGSFERRLGDCAREMASDYVWRMSPVDSDGESTFTNIAVKIDKTVTDVCVDVISDHQTDLGLSAVMEYGFFVGGFKDRLGNAFVEGLSTARRMAKVGPALAEKNRALPPGERLTGQEMATLSRATSTFLVQAPRPDAEANWGASAAKRADMLAAIAYNLSRAEAAMKLNEGERLSDAAVRHAALNMGLIDGKLIISIHNLSQADFNALLLEAGQLDADAENGGHGLATAVSALRGARELLSQVAAPPPKADDDEE